MVKAIKSQNFTGLHRRDDERESVQDGVGAEHEQGGVYVAKREYSNSFYCAWAPRYLPCRQLCHVG